MNTAAAAADCRCQARLFVRAGVTKVRLTGGEPTVRRDLVDIVRSLNGLREEGLRTIAMTSNGLHQPKNLRALSEGGRVPPGCVFLPSYMRVRGCWGDEGGKGSEWQEPSARAVAGSVEAKGGPRPREKEAGGGGVAGQLVEAQRAEGAEQGLQGLAGLFAGAEIFVVTLAGPVIGEHGAVRRPIEGRCAGVILQRGGHLPGSGCYRIPAPTPATGVGRTGRRLQNGV